MSGICGIVAAGAPLRDDGTELAGMLAGLDVACSGGARAWTEGRTALGALPGPGDPAGLGEIRAGRDRIAMAFEGTLFGSIAPGPGAAVETLLRRYLERGVDFLSELRGDFAAAVWDGRTGTMLLAVDPFRVHPVFWAMRQGGFVFASRMRSLTECPRVGPLSIDPGRIVEVVSASMIASPRTVFREVRKLRPGHVLELGAGEPKVRSYWDLDFHRKSRASARDLRRSVREVFGGSVRARLAAESDPERIGAFLSGGIDSSTVTGVLTEATGAPVRTFSIGFAERSFNEMEYARITARKFGSRHHEYFVTPEDTAKALPILLERFDEPFANSSAVPAFYCAKLAKDHGVDVLYAGDAGDELFAGNPWYATQRLFDYWERIPRLPREWLVRPGVDVLSSAGVPFAEKARKYIRRASIPYPQRMTSYGFFSEFPMDRLFEPDFLAGIEPGFEPEGAVYDLYRLAPAEDNLDRRLYIDIKLIIGDNDVLKVTRMAQAAGIAVRFPFLDREVAEFAAALPPQVKMRGRRLRSFFKDAYADMLPPEVLVKKKHGFGLPIPVWLRTDPELHAIMRDLILGTSTVQRGIFRKEALEDLVRHHATDTTSFFGTALWHVMMVEMWLRGRGAARSATH